MCATCAAYVICGVCHMRKTYAGWFAHVMCAWVVFGVCTWPIHTANVSVVATTVFETHGFMFGRPCARTVRTEAPRNVIATADQTGAQATSPCIAYKMLAVKLRVMRTR